MAYKRILVALSVIAAASPAVAVHFDPAMVPGQNDGAWTRYCMKVEPVTGSRVETIECWTRAEWAEQGVDVDRDWPKEGVSVIS